MYRTVGCIGLGNMGSAIMSGLDGTGLQLFGHNRSPKTLAGVETLPDACAVARRSDLLILAVKPYQTLEMLSSVRTELGPDKTVLSVAAGITLEALRKAAGPAPLVARCMPTTTALAGKGIFAFSFDRDFPAAEKDALLELFGRLGLALTLPEERMTSFSALIGAGPAYVFSMMAGLAQAGVTLGFSHAETRSLIPELFAGCAALAQKSPAHLIRLRDDVCSPAGLTIAGVNVLDRAGLAGLLVEAVCAAQKRGLDMER